MIYFRGALIRPRLLDLAEQDAAGVVADAAPDASARPARDRRAS